MINIRLEDAEIRKLLRNKQEYDWKNRNEKIYCDYQYAAQTDFRIRFIHKNCRP